MSKQYKYLVVSGLVAIIAVVGVFAFTDKAEAEVNQSGFTFSASISEIKDLACALFDKCPEAEEVTAEKTDIKLGAVANVESCASYGGLVKCSVRVPLSTRATSTRFFYEYPATTTPIAWYIKIEEATTTQMVVEFGIGDGSGAKATSTRIGYWAVAANAKATIRATSTMGQGKSTGTGAISTWGSSGEIIADLIIPPKRPYLINMGGAPEGGTAWGTNDEGTAILEFLVLD